MVVNETENYRITFYQRDTDRLVLSVASAGRMPDGSLKEEFKKTLDRTGVSQLHIADKKIRWFNHVDTPKIFGYIDELSRDFKHVGAVGASMGGSGALLLSNVIRNLSRVLTFSPQFSICPPFVSFDDRYKSIGENISHTFSNFSVIDPKISPVLIYGTSEWKDLVHARMFELAGLMPLYVKDYPHEVPIFLKKEVTGNKLQALLDQFCDFRSEFDVTKAEHILQDLTIQIPRLMANAKSKADIWSLRKSTVIELPTIPEIFENLSTFGTPSQSSRWVWSTGQTKESDALRAVNGHRDQTYAFHTDLEYGPWWMMRFEEVIQLKQLWLFNRFDKYEFSMRSNRMSIKASMEGEDWETLCTLDLEVPFGGIDGRPYIFSIDEEKACRFIKLQLDASDYFHLAQVEIYGLRDRIR